MFCNSEIHIKSKIFYANQKHKVNIIFTIPSKDFYKTQKLFD